ncbi:AMP-binding protein [Marinibaculum pumilum]|uniref:AMP-binding protein n=1 Tax=Marinibaculum pumilum TaxID=1766165 RepID=A0ABV7L3P4_9PROT
MNVRTSAIALAHGTVARAFAATVGRHAARPFVCVTPATAAAYGIDAGDLSYDAAAAAVEGLTDRYRAAGYGHGHRAGILLENRPDFLLHWLALNALGVSVVPINAEFRSAELDYLVDHSEIALAIVPQDRAADLADAAARTGRPLAVSVADAAEPGAAVPEPAFAAPLAGRAPDLATECALLYTSGTTGRPKGCILPNEYFLWGGEWYRSTGGLIALREGQERLITPLPLVHMNALACSTMAMLVTGGCVVQLDRFHPTSWWDSVRQGGATICHYLGVMPAMLMGAPAGPADRDHALRFGFGAGVDPRHHAAFEERFGFPLIEAWAMTETGVGGCVIASEEPRFVGEKCFGRAAPEVEARVVGEDGAEVAPGAEGELLVRRAGPDPSFGFFKGYLKNEAATAEAWAGGWFHTGDVVTRDADGYFRFVDRKKNVIRRSGENIAAVEVESVLLQHPEVAAAGVAAVPDAVRGDEVMALVVPKRPVGEGEQAAFAEGLVRFCLERLAYYKAPGHVALCETLPLTATQKVQRGELKALAAALLDGPSCTDTRALKKRQS